MTKKTKLLMLYLSISLIMVSVLVYAQCSGQKYGWTWNSYYGKCWAACGSSSECDKYFPGQKGGCAFGQACSEACQCIWLDRDFDGYTGACGDGGWVTFDTVDVIGGQKQTWTITQNLAAEHIKIVQTKGSTYTNITSIEVYNDKGIYTTYPFYKLTMSKPFSKNFGEIVRVTKVVVDWDDNNKANKAKLQLFTGTKSPSCDCDDYNPYIHSGAKEICDNADNDCDGIIDEDDACEQYIYLCKSDKFTLQSEGLGKSMSFGYCADGAWCTERINGDTGSCDYLTSQQDIGKKQFYAYICDMNTCYNFTKGTFMVCGPGWDCSTLCMPGDCNFLTKEWCNDEGVWQTDFWCHSECGKSDSTCGGSCEQGACDTYAKKWCDKGYWFDTNYCSCDVCGSKDSTCPACTCKKDYCDTTNAQYCENSVWKSGSPYCFNNDCCRKDYNCFISGECSTCMSGTCDVANNKYCLNQAWTGKDYCDYCEKYDYDCGAGPCEDGRCDTKRKKYCKNGNWTLPGESYCFPGYCGTKDKACNCKNTKDDCCSGLDDGSCDYDCLKNTDPDCGICSANANDCCDDTLGNGCDADCVPKVDPDCQTNCKSISDDCCSGAADDACDPDCTTNSDKDCTGTCTINTGDCCLPNKDNICDADCIQGVDPDCIAHPCDENWVCEEWDRLCDGVNDQHTCKKWVDKSGCNTFYDKPEDFQNCYVEFTCTADDDKDGDSYPRRACYDAVNQKVLEELDCGKDDDPAQHPGADEVCNGKDDDCDDSKDEGCPCVGGDTQGCGRTEGVCRQGQQICVNGFWNLCGGSGYIAPQKEVCDNGADDNCDSYVDENCVCVEGAKQDCGADVGICKKGWQACYNNSFGSVCNEEAKGSTEVCDNKLDDDCDTFTDGDDSSCQVTTPVTSGAEHCKNRKQDAGETGVDCGDGKDCPDCAEKAPACGYGAITEKCTCGKAEYKTGYCCNGKYSLIECKEPAKDSDSDGCTDDKELQVGTDVNSGDTDGDGLLDCDTSEANPLCNEDGVCDTERDYPESLENCPEDCGKKGGVGWLTWLTLLLILLSLTGVGAYLYAKSKGCKLSDFIKIRGKKKEEKQSLPLGDYKPAIPAAQPAQYTKPAQSTILKHPMQPTVIKPATGKGRELIRLQGFVDNCLRKGYTKLQIKNAALKFGWTEEEVENAFQGKKSKYSIFK